MNELFESEQSETSRRSVVVLATISIVVVLAVLSVVIFTLPILTSGVALPENRGSFYLIPIVIVAILASALIILVRLGRPTLSALVLISVWTLITTFVVLIAGVNSYAPALLVLPICAAGLLFDRAASISLAVIASFLVGGVAWLEAHTVIPDPPPPAVIGQILESNKFLIAAGFWIVVCGTMAALTSLLAGGLQQALSRSTAQAKALRLLSEELEARVETQTRALLDQERQSAMLEERTRLSREIHDTIAQGLAGVSVQLGAAQRAITIAPQDAQEHLELAQQLARESLAEARRSVWNLRAVALERGNLADALRSMAETASKSTIQCDFIEEGPAWPLTVLAEGALLRVAQEGLANASKHSQASAIRLILAFDADAITLTIHDNGVGFPPQLLLVEQPVPQRWGGFGLLGMRERLAALQGRVSLRNNSGAMVIASIPRRIADDTHYRG